MKRARRKPSIRRRRRRTRQHRWIRRRGGQHTFKSGVFRARVVRAKDGGYTFQVSALTPTGSTCVTEHHKTLENAKRAALVHIARGHRKIGADVMRRA